MIKRFTQALVVLSALALCVPARAVELQRPGAPEVWPGKWMFGLHPFGFQAAFDPYSTGGYKLDIDIGYRVKELSKISVWVGAMFSYTFPLYTCANNQNGRGGDLAGCAHDPAFLLFVRLTFEKLVQKLPLVPYVELGLGADILIYGAHFGTSGTNLGFGVPLRLGGGVHYWLTKHFGIGAETHFNFGPGIYPTIGGEVINCGPGNSTCVSFYGYWDFLLGVRASF